ncbi:endonuclease [Paraneptunicella aestuarii]|uniref:endonuclease n=1 Tax=Paraneptunicella aestuarii TaxID=2831148 RepID=UPI001E62E3F0|nr:endonuclease [Paraneptunicella aestuarii]UAA38450.1 endonuclease [Paraneptunicella aestuarii]
MKRTVSAALIALCCSQTAMAQVSNGDFENWSGSTPTGWTTIDSGISVAQSTTYSYTGSSSAKITVNTGTQASTDFRQTINVTSGQTYDFSVRIYHTEGNVQARLYVGNYLNYSNNSLTNQWQELTYSYTASTTGTLEVGLRFYDQTGFDGSEVVYVDSFLPTDTSGGGSGGGGGGGGSCANTAATFSLTTDNYGSETSWDVKDSSNTTLYSGNGYASNTSYNEEFCLADGDYTFTIYDSYGDGICCSFGNGAYSITSGGQTLVSGSSFTSSETKAFTIGAGSGGGGGGGSGDLTGYYQNASGLTGYALKTALHNIIKTHTSQGYSALWTFYSANEIDRYYENDGTILDIYSENPTGGDPYSYIKSTDQCGTYSGEGNCYNREHSFPRSWFGGAIEPMNSDVHHIFASDGYVNGRRSSFPYGEVGSASYTSNNGSKLGTGSGIGYTGTVFEPIDEFKGDLARAYFYMATRYEDRIAGWETNSTSSNDVLNGTNTQVFEAWTLAMLKLWHTQDPVSQKEIDRNNAAQTFQGNRNPFVDHPEFVTEIWGN